MHHGWRGLSFKNGVLGNAVSVSSFGMLPDIVTVIAIYGAKHLRANVVNMSPVWTLSLQL